MARRNRPPLKHVVLASHPRGSARRTPAIRWGAATPVDRGPIVGTLADPARLKWRDLVLPDTPLPTPWAKDEYEGRTTETQRRRGELRDRQASEEELEKLFERDRAESTHSLRAAQYAGKVGAFEGAMYSAKGLYRPAIDCIMFSRNDVGFCPVCSRAIERIIDMYTH